MQLATLFLCGAEAALWKAVRRQQHQQHHLRERGGSLASDQEGVLTVGAVAHRLGVAVPTLRSWERRYGLSPSAQSPGGHRRYTPQDMERLRWMVALTGDGVPPAAAARVVLGEERTPPPGRHGGGSGSLAVGRVHHQAVRGLSRDAARLDVDGVHRRVADHIRRRGVTDTWSDILVPLLESIGNAYERTPEEVVPIEHTVTAGTLAALHEVSPCAERGRLPAILACAPEEQHTLPLEAMRAALAERDVAARFLGARLPADALSRSASRLRPTAVVVWAHAPSLARKVPLSQVQGDCSVLLLAGPGWQHVRAARAYAHLSSLHDALRTVLDAAGR